MFKGFSLSLCTILQFANMKKSFCFILLFCMIIYTGGYQLIGTCFQLSLHSEMKAYLKQNLNNKYNTVFTFQSQNQIITDPGLVWEEENEEFLFKGNLYDVVSIEYNDSCATLYCIDDRAESNLLSKTGEIRKRQNQKSNGPMAVFHKLLLIAIDLQNPNYLPLQITVQKDFITAIIKMPISLAPDLLSPPPEYYLA